MLWFTLCGTLAGPSALLFRMHHNGFDSSDSHAFSQFLRRLRERGVTIFMATHDLFRAKEDATRVGIMRHGKLAHILTAAELSHTDLEKLYLETMAA